tara:strand:- start:424 stop:1152 length:729 start_codon:yes stop_codon:yes gene_type:complete
MKIAILIPCTSNRREYKSLVQTDLYEYFFKSFFTTYSDEHEYNIYLGIDNDDDFYTNPSIQDNIFKFVGIMKNCEVEFNYFDPNMYKGKPCWIWNELYKKAITDEYDYFVQCGSDISFIDKGWVNNAIKRLKDKDDIGVVGLVDAGRKKFNPNDTLLTQTMVSKKHYDIFGFYFPLMLPSWSSDNWIGDIYDLEGRKIIIGHRLYNCGGEPRYDVPSDHRKNYYIAMKKYINNIKIFISPEN